jgi:hypothetical protein
MKLIPAGDLTSAERVLPVRWCLGSLETEQLKERQASNIHILLLVAYEGSTLEDRQLLPIDQMIAYLNFRRPGKHTVFAKVVYGDKLKNLLGKTSDTQYNFRVLDWERNLVTDEKFLDRFQINTIEGKAELEVVIPEEHFPKEPPAWLMKLANIGFDYPPIDQCSFRRRLLFSPPKLFFMGIWAGLKIITRAILALIFVLCLGRDIDFVPILHPWHRDLDDLSYRNTWFSHDRHGERRYSKGIYLLHPLLWIGILAVLATVAHFTHKNLWKMLATVFVAIVKFIISIAGPLVAVVLGLLVAGVVGALLGRYAKKRNRQRLAWKNSDAFRQQEERKRQEKERMREQAYDDLALLLACRPAITAEISSLPPVRRTLHLRFLNLKRKVCRPYAAK